MLQRVPPLLKLALLGSIGLVVVRLVALLFGPVIFAFGESSVSAINACGMAISLAMCAGAFELASRLTGRGRAGARIAAYAAVAGLVVDLAKQAVTIEFYAHHTTTLFELIALVGLAITLVGTLGYAVAAYVGADDRRHRARTLVAAAIALLALASVWVMPMLIDPGQGGIGYVAKLDAIHSAVSIARSIALLAMISLARPSPVSIASTPLAALGLRTIAGSLWWRVIGTFVGAFGMTLATEGSFQLAILAQAGLEAIVLAMLALGAFAVARSAIDGVPRRAFTIAGLAAGWCSGVMIAKLPYLYMLTNGTVADVDFKVLDSLSVGEPIVAVAAIAAAVFALRNIAALASLADSASSRGLAFIVAMLIAVGLANLGISSVDGLAMFAFGGLFSLIGLGLVASVMSRAARTIAIEQPAIPTATIVA